MGNVSVTCEARINTLVNQSNTQITKNALLGLYGYQSCCTDMQQVFKAVILKKLVDKYNDRDADGNVLETINLKQAECYCNWVNRQFPNETPVSV